MSVKCHLVAVRRNKVYSIQHKRISTVLGVVGNRWASAIRSDEIGGRCKG